MNVKSNQWIIGLGAFVVIAVAAVTIFLVTQPPAARQEATGAIGTAERFRGEQIKEGDVGVTAPGTEVSGEVTDAELAEALGRSSDGVRAAVYGRLQEATRSEMIGRAPQDLQGKIFDLAAHEVQADALGRLDADSLGRILGRLSEPDLGRYVNRLGMTAEAFARMSPTERADTVARADLEARKIALAGARDADRAEMVSRFTPAQMRDLSGRLPERISSELVQRSDLTTRSSLVGALSLQERNDLTQRVVEARDLSGRLGNASGDLLVQLFDRADAATRNAIIGKMDAATMVRVLLRADPTLQATFLERTTDNEREMALAKADPDLLADLVGRVSHEARAEAAGRLDEQTLGRILVAAKIDRDSWNRMSPSERGDRLARADGAARVELYGGFSKAGRAELWGVASVSERLRVAAKSPDIVGRTYQRVDESARTTFNALTNAAERQDAIGRSDLFTRAELTGVASRDELGRMQDRIDQGRQDQGRQQQ